MVNPHLQISFIMPFPWVKVQAFAKDRFFFWIKGINFLNLLTREN